MIACCLVSLAPCCGAALSHSLQGHSGSSLSPPRMRICLLLLLSLSLAAAEKKKDDEPRPPCPIVNPYKDLEAWHKLDSTDCNATSNVAELSEAELEYKKWGEKKFAFDVLASDRIGPRRDVGWKAHELCKNASFPASYKTSIVMIYHNEALSVLLRMVNGILEKTPKELIHEIVLFDDHSEDDMIIQEKVREYATIAGWPMRLVLERADKREGLIRAKVLAARVATGDVLVFLDSHCEVTDNWLPPLLAPIHDDEKSVVVPIVDLINPLRFNFDKSMIAKSGFDWALNFKWVYLPWQYFEEDDNNVKPFPSPSMPGGLLAVKRSYFVELGEYDMGMEIWGGENVEMSLRTWMCGGRVLVAPCSRIGHVFRMRRPYKTQTHVPSGDTNCFNSARAAKVWLGDYEERFLTARPRARTMQIGDVSDRIALKEKLGCKDMQWFIDNVYPELMPEEERQKMEKEKEEEEKKEKTTDKKKEEL